MIGAVLLGGSDWAARLADECGVNVASFYHGRHRLIWAAIKRVAGPRNVLDAITVIDELRRAGQLEDAGGHAYIITLETTVTAVTSAPAHAAVLRSLELRREAVALATALDSKARNGFEKHEVAKIITQIRGLQLDDADNAKQRSTTGAAFILDQRTEIAAVWGSDDTIAWPSGESLILVGPAGTGKTTLAQQLILARIGLQDEVLGMPVAPDNRPVLYIAADRPSQARRSFARMVSEHDRDELHERLRVWAGPLERDIAAHPDYLTDLAEQHGAGTVVIDSLKDVALDLAKDETGSRVNAAFQRAVASDIQVLALHHQRKAQAGAPKPKTLADVYGSTWITAGAGSVLLLWGEPGDPVVTLSTLKPAIGDVGPMRIIHNHHTGRSRIRDHATLNEALRRAGPAGLTAKTTATILYDTNDPTDAHIERARYQLDKLCRDGHATRGEDIPITYTWHATQKTVRNTVRTRSDTPESCQTLPQKHPDTHATKRSEQGQTPQTPRGSEGLAPLKGATLTLTEPDAENILAKTPEPQFGTLGHNAQKEADGLIDVWSPD